MYGERIKQLTNYAGITSAKIADDLGWTRSYFSQLALNKTTPSADKLVLIANYFTKLINRKVNLDWFLTGEGSMFIEAQETDANTLTIKLKKGQKLHVEYED